MPILDKQISYNIDEFRRVGSTVQTCPVSCPPLIDAGYFSSTASDIGSGLRFRDIQIPQGVTITKAYLTLTAQASFSGVTVNTRISAEDVDDAGSLEGITNTQVNTRWAARTTARVDWDAIPAWTAETEYTSPSIKTVIQEIVSRAGWVNGNAIVIFWDDFDSRSSTASGAERRAYAYNVDNDKAVQLHIEFGSSNVSGYSKVFPTEAITRVTGLTHLYNRKKGIDTLEIHLGEVTTDFGLPEWAERPQATTPAAVQRQKEEEISSSPAVKKAVDSAIKRTPTSQPRTPSEGGMTFVPTPKRTVDISPRTREIIKTPAYKAAEARRKGIQQGVKAVVTPYAVSVLERKEEAARLLTRIQGLQQLASRTDITGAVRTPLLKRVITLKKQLEELYRR